MIRVNDILVDRYIIESIIGHGGIGIVFKGRDLMLDRAVAIKVLRTDAQETPEIIERFRLEANCIAALSHPNTLKLLDFGQTDDGSFYMVTDYLDGTSLDKIYADPALRPKTLPLLQWITEICSALEEAHLRNIIHRDIKPSNIIIQNLGKHSIARIIDFGIAKWGDNMTLTGHFMGSFAYMSPEQTQNAKSVTAQSDIYSIGVVLWEGLVGKKLFGKLSHQGYIFAHIEETPPNISEAGFNEDIPDLENLIAQMLQKIPNDRPSSMHEVEERIKDIIGRIRPPTNISTDPTPNSVPPATQPDEIPTQLDMRLRDLLPNKANSQGDRLVCLSHKYSGEVIVLDQPVMAIGRIKDNDIVFELDFVSRHHAQLVRQNGVVRIIDLDSTHGIKVNGSSTQNVILQRFDTIELGTLKLQFVPDGTPLSKKN